MFADESMILPNFVGIGAPKCGTTWLALCLANRFRAVGQRESDWRILGPLSLPARCAESPLRCIARREVDRGPAQPH